MKRGKIIPFLIFYSILLGCVDEGIQDEVKDTNFNLIKEINIRKDQSTPPPSDLPHIVIEFYKEVYQFDTQKFYNTEGFETLNISINNLAQDTLSYTLFEYNNQTLISKSFYLWDDLSNPKDSFKYFYNKEGKLSQILRNGKNFEKYIYQDGQIERIYLGADETFFYEFTYANNKIIRQVYRTITDIEYPIMDWKYVYDETGNLISKDLIRPEEISEPMFKFEYDEKNRLIESREYDLFIDPYLMVRKVYKYYPSSNQ